MTKDDKWLKEPQLLFKHENDWLVLNEQTSSNNSDIFTSFSVEKSPEKTNILREVSRFSSWLRLIKRSARVFKYQHSFRMKRLERLKYLKHLDVDLISQATNLLTIQNQEKCFS